VDIPCEMNISFVFQMTVSIKSIMREGPCKKLEVAPHVY
jgi:hypothetical protein